MKRDVLYKIVLIVIIVSLVILVSIKIFYPAYLSYGIACKEDFKLNEKYALAGQVTIEYKEGEKIINKEIFYLEKNILKHENCHVVQALNNRLLGCNRPIFLYLNEVECYVAQYEPDFIYKNIYGEYNE